MKKKIAVLAIMLCVAASSTAFARGGYNNHGGGYSNHGGGYNHGYRGGRHNDGLGIAVGVVGGLLLGSALYSAAPPQTVVYGSPYPTYQPEVVVVRQPRVCVEDRQITGEWQNSRYDGRQVWVPFAYPVIQRVQVPCY